MTDWLWEKPKVISSSPNKDLVWPLWQTAHHWLALKQSTKVNQGSGQLRSTIWGSMQDPKEYMDILGSLCPDETWNGVLDVKRSSVSETRMGNRDLYEYVNKIESLTKDWFRTSKKKKIEN